MDQAVAQGWAGIDVGKGHHWVCLIDESDSTLWSRKVVNDEAAILEAIGEVLSRAQQVSWAVDITGTSSALLLALLTAHGQQATYVPGRTVNQISTAYIGEAKTDARDAYVIAETVRHRGDLTPVDVPAALVTELRLLVTHRTDLVADRVRLINRLRDVLSGYFPALERAFDYSASRGAVVLLTGYQTPAAIRARGRSRLRSVRVFHVGSILGPAGRGGQGAVAVAQRSCQAGPQGQFVGRCSTSRRADEATRAGTAMRWVRRVAHRAFAWRGEAAAPAARRTLNATQASASQAALAVSRRTSVRRCRSAWWTRSWAWP